MYIILVYDITPTMHIYLIFCKISMQICVHNVFAIRFLVLRAMILYHIMISHSPLFLLIFCISGFLRIWHMHAYSYDTLFVAHLIATRYTEY
jgi:hypothetical protein